MEQTPEAETPPATAAPILSAVRYLLRPLVRLLLHHGIGLGALVDLLKTTYVRVAEEDAFCIPGKAQTDSRISLLTGVHRKDVRRLRSASGIGAHVRHLPLGAQVVARWTGLPDYLDAAGQPRALPRRSATPDEVSFEGLVESISKDFRARVVLDEWLRLGLVRLNDEGDVLLETDAFVPGKGSEEKAYFLGHHLHDHLAAAVHNVAGGQPAFFERGVYHDCLSVESVKELTRVAELSGNRLLQSINRRATELEQVDAARGGGDRRITLGIFLYTAKGDLPAFSDESNEADA